MKTLLFDLDGTLLPLEFELFFQEYIKSISAYCSGLVEPAFFVKTLLKCTGVMVRNDGTLTNEELFMRNFLPALGLQAKEIYPVLENYYSREFGKLRRFVLPSSLAPRILEHVLAAGWQIVLATNPLFPRMAIEERMRWAGIDGFAWKYVSSYETSRACKPSLRYYREIMEILDLNPRECWMVGNDLTEDMVAGRLGMKTYLVTDYCCRKGEDCPPPDRQGTLADLFGLVKSGRLS